MADQPDAIVGGCQASNDLAGAIAAAIVDDDDLVHIGKCGKRRQRVVDDGVDIGLFIECGKDETKAAGKSRYRQGRGG